MRLGLIDRLPGLAVISGRKARTRFYRSYQNNLEGF